MPRAGVDSHLNLPTPRDCDSPARGTVTLPIATAAFHDWGRMEAEERRHASSSRRDLDPAAVEPLGHPAVSGAQVRDASVEHERATIREAKHHRPRPSRQIPRGRPCTSPQSAPSPRLTVAQHACAERLRGCMLRAWLYAASPRNVNGFLTKNSPGTSGTSPLGERRRRGRTSFRSLCATR